MGKHILDKTRRKLAEFPPIVCFLLARESVSASGRGKCRHIGIDALVERSHLSRDEILRLSWQTSWGEETLSSWIRFLDACDIDLDDRRNLFKHRKFLKEQAEFDMPYLQSSSNYRRDFLPRITTYRAHLAKVSAKG